MGRVKLTNPDKVLYPETGTTKAEIFDYYVEVAAAMLPHVAGRAVTRKRWPNGVAEGSFFEKQLASSAPEWLDRGTIVHKSGTTTYPLIDTVEGLAWIAQQAALEVHVPQWRFVDHEVGPATRIVFDLDPGEGVLMRQLCEVAHEVRDLISDIGLRTFPLTSGSKGLHLYVPLDDPISSQGASVLAKRVALQLEQTMPKKVTATMTKSLREGKVFLDWSQNNGNKTTIAPYSLRGRDHPTVAAPRTWDEIGDPDLRHLTFHEVLERLGRDGDLLAELDEPLPMPDRLTTYRGMRDTSKTPEPVPAEAPKVGHNDAFVIQEHHARRLHYDFRLERDGVLVSWAVPKNLPDSPSENHLAVHTEDHPMEYLTFAGEIPKGEYGGGEVYIWDTGTYETEKFNDNPPDGPGRGGEVIVTLHGAKVQGRYALIQTDGKNWLAHRMKDQKQTAFADLLPMLTTEGSVERLPKAQWAFEGKWDGYRVLVEADHGNLAVRSRRGRDVTAEYPQFQALAADLAEHHVILDGEAVALDESGVPSFGEMQNRKRSTRVEFWAFDILLARRPTPAAGQVLRSQAAAGGARRPGGAHRACADRRRRPRRARLRRGAALGRGGREEAGFHLSARAPVCDVDQGQAVEHPGGGDRRLARGHRRAHQWPGRAAARHPHRGRSEVRRPGRHRVHREGAGLAEEDAHAPAHRRITVRHRTSPAGREGCHVRPSRARRGGPVQRAHG